MVQELVGAGPASECQSVILPRRPTSNERQVLDYALLRPRSWPSFFAKRVAIWIAVAALLFVAAFALPHPTGIWYFGSQHPKWLVAIDSAGLTVCREGDVPRSSGWVPVIIAKLIVYGSPVWLIWRVWFRSRRSRAAAG